MPQTQRANLLKRNIRQFHHLLFCAGIYSGTTLIMYKLASSLRRVRPWKDTIIKAWFCDDSKGGCEYKVYEDWQYRQMIAAQLKDNNCVKAVSLVFQSYLNNRVLDIQIYSQLFNKLYNSQLPPSYPEMLYLIYHEHFPPHPLTKKWIQKLIFSSNKELIQKLRVDYRKMGEPYPLRKSIKRQLRQQKKMASQEPQIQESSTQQQQSNKPKTSPVDLLKKYLKLHNIDVEEEEIDDNIDPEKLFRLKLLVNMTNILSQLNVTTCQHTEVDIDGLSVQFLKGIQNQEAELPQLPSDQQYEFQEMTNHIPNLFGIDISKIKIKKMEIKPKNDPF